MKKVILASQSPRRRELMTLLSVPFEIKTADTEECIDNALLPSENVCLLATKKAEAISRNDKENWVLGCDTVVVYEERILGKPKDVADARKMLQLLSGHTHQVYTGVALVNEDEKIKRNFCVCTQVKMKHLTEEEIDNYIQTGEPMDKAGSYAIQGKGAVFIERIEGDYFNVVGLPVAKLYDLFKELYIID